MYELPKMVIKRQKVLSEKELIEQLKAGDNLIAKKTHKYREVERCWTQHHFGTVRLPTFEKLLSAGKLEPVDKEDYDGTVLYRLKKGE